VLEQSERDRGVNSLFPQTVWED